MDDKLSDKYISEINAVLKIMPEDEINLVIDRGQQFSRDKWWWGDRANMWVKVALGSGHELTKEGAIRALAQMSGISKSSLYRYGYHAEFFPEEIREYYMPAPFSHFVVAKSHGDDWPKILQTSLDYLEAHGRLPSAEFLEWKFSRNAEEAIKMDDDFKKDDRGNWLDPVGSRNTDPFAEQDPPAVSWNTARDWIGQTDFKLRNIAASIDRLPVSKDAKTKLQFAFDALHEAFEEAIGEISALDPARLSGDGDR